MGEAGGGGLWHPHTICAGLIPRGGHQRCGCGLRCVAAACLCVRRAGRNVRQGGWRTLCAVCAVGTDGGVGGGECAVRSSGRCVTVQPPLLAVPRPSAPLRGLAEPQGRNYPPPSPPSVPGPRDGGVPAGTHAVGVSQRRSKAGGFGGRTYPPPWSPSPCEINGTGTEKSRDSKASVVLTEAVNAGTMTRPQQHSNASSRPRPPCLWRCKGSQWLKAGGSKWQDVLHVPVKYHPPAPHHRKPVTPARQPQNYPPHSTRPKSDRKSTSCCSAGAVVLAKRRGGYSTVGASRWQPLAVPDSGLVRAPPPPRPETVTNSGLHKNGHAQNCTSSALNPRITQRSGQSPWLQPRQRRRSCHTPIPMTCLSLPGTHKCTGGPMGGDYNRS